MTEKIDTTRQNETKNPGCLARYADCSRKNKQN